MSAIADSTLLRRTVGFVAALTRSLSGFGFGKSLLGALKNFFGFEHAAFIYFDTETFEASYPVYSRIPDSAIAEYRERYDDEAIFMRAIRADRKLLARKYLAIGDVMRESDYEGSVYYRDIVRPAGSRDVIVLPIASKGRVAGGLAIMKPEEEGSFTPNEKRLLSMLNEPVRALFDSHLEILRLRAETEIEETAYDNLSVGVLIVDQDGMVRKVNAVAERLCQRLFSGDPRQAVSRLLASLDRRRGPGLVRLDSFPRYEGSAIDIKVVPVSYVTPAQGISYRSVIYLEEVAGNMDRFERFAAHFSLSSREQEIVAHVLEGEDNTMIAAKLCLSGNTIRTHLQHIYAKLSISSRISIIQLFRGMA